MRCVIHHALALRLHFFFGRSAECGDLLSQAIEFCFDGFELGLRFLERRGAFFKRLADAC